MRCQILHECGGRIRVHLLNGGMSLHQADMLEYYLRSKPFTQRVKVYDRTGDAVVWYCGDRSLVIRALARFSYTDSQTAALVGLKQLMPVIDVEIGIVAIDMQSLALGAFHHDIHAIVVTVDAEIQRSDSHGDCHIHIVGENRRQLVGSHWVLHAFGTGRQNDGPYCKNDICEIFSHINYPRLNNTTMCVDNHPWRSFSRHSLDRPA